MEVIILLSFNILFTSNKPCPLFFPLVLYLSLPTLSSSISFAYVFDIIISILSLIKYISIPSFFSSDIELASIALSTYTPIILAKSLKFLVSNFPKNEFSICLEILTDTVIPFLSASVNL